MTSDAERRRLAEIGERHRQTRVSPGFSVAFGRGAVGDHTATFGHHSYDLSRPVNVSTVYDIASVTKAMSTTALLMQLVSQEGLSLLDAPSSELLPGAPTSSTLAELLGHASGFPAHIRFYEDLPRSATQRDDVLRAAMATPMAYPAGSKTVYSDLGYILLGRILEHQLGDRQDRLFQDRIASPLGLSKARYLYGDEADVAPTEDTPGRGVIRGSVHDDNAFFAGGVCGHAGLFSTASDVATFAKTILAIWRGETRIGIDPAVLRHFLTRPAAPDTSWRLGWDTPGPVPGDSHAGDAWPRTSAVGHLGFTGCSLWLSLDDDAYAVMLSNRVHPTRDNQGIRALRREVMDWMTAQLGLAR